MSWQGITYHVLKIDTRKLTESTFVVNISHCYGPLRAVNGPYVLHKASLLLTVRMLSTNGAWISLLHEGTMRYGSFDPYGPKTYGACISLLHQGRALRFVQSVRSADIRSVHLIITSGHTALRFVRSVRSARQERRTPTEERFWHLRLANVQGYLCCRWKVKRS